MVSPKGTSYCSGPRTTHRPGKGLDSAGSLNISLVGRKRRWLPQERTSQFLPWHRRLECGCCSPPTPGAWRAETTKGEPAVGDRAIAAGTGSRPAEARPSRSDARRVAGTPSRRQIRRRPIRIATPASQMVTATPCCVCEDNWCSTIRHYFDACTWHRNSRLRWRSTCSHGA